MGTLHRTGAQVVFESVFVPAATAQKAELGKVYVRASQWLDCTAGMKREAWSQAYADGGLAIGGRDPPEPAPTPIRPGSTWGAVRDLVCTGRNDLSPTPLAGSDPQAVAQVRAYVADHPLAP